MATVECHQWWNNFGISYANNQESNGNQQMFNEFYHNKHPFTDESGPQFKKFAQGMGGQDRPRQQWNGVPPINNNVYNRMNNRVQRPGSRQKPISLAVNSKRTLEIIPYNVENEENVIEPHIIEISSKPMPIRLNFKSFSTPIDIQQTMAEGRLTFILFERVYF